MTNAEDTAFAGHPDNCSWEIRGLSKREYMATAAMQGIMANPFYPEMVTRGAGLGTTFAKEAVEFADALIDALNAKD